MAYETEIETERYYSVGPFTDMFGHGAVTIMTDVMDDGTHREVLNVCLDCGAVVGDKRVLLSMDCGREHNPINQTWRERADEYDEPFGTLDA